MKIIFLLMVILPGAIQTKAQVTNCTFKKPVVSIRFNGDDEGDINTASLSNYSRVSTSCPTDGHYTYTSYTSDCFRGDWLTLSEDHTPDDVSGKMMLVNASRNSGVFLTTTINGLKSNTEYEFSAWMLNVCKISDKCPFPLLPDILIRLQKPSGEIVAQFGTGELQRRHGPYWTPYRALFKTPPAQMPLTLTMINNAPGGCGNDFALDDIMFRECVRRKPVAVTATVPPPLKRPRIIRKPVPKKETQVPVKLQDQAKKSVKPQPELPMHEENRKEIRTVFPAPPPILRTRKNLLVKQIETEVGEIKIDLYDNGEIDGDTVSVYHNNTLLVSHQKLSQKPISFRIAVNTAHSYHELVMVAENLGSIPPNTSLMIVTAGSSRNEVFISSSEQQNAKVVLELKK